MSYDISIQSIEANGKHGVYEKEKINSQKFYVDLDLKINDLNSDEILKTLNYEDLIKDVIYIVESKSFNLIETLSKFIARFIVEKYHNLNLIKVLKIKVTVHKPDTELNKYTKDISVTYYEEPK